MKYSNVYWEGFAISRNDGKLLDERVIRKLIDNRNDLKELNSITRLDKACIANLV